MGCRPLLHGSKQSGLVRCTLCSPSQGSAFDQVKGALMDPTVAPAAMFPLIVSAAAGCLRVGPPTSLRAC